MMTIDDVLNAQRDGLVKLRAPFEPHQISKLPKETSQQIQDRKTNGRLGIRCNICGSWHHKDAIHLDYVGHAALTDRLLEADPMWFWEPLAFDVAGLPLFDKTGGLWIRLTVCGVSRLGYGNAAAKPNQDLGAREKEVIGDALRNAAMRFGAALDLWHKGQLHVDSDEKTLADDTTAKVDHDPDTGEIADDGWPGPDVPAKGDVARKSSQQLKSEGAWELLTKTLGLCQSQAHLSAWNATHVDTIKSLPQKWKLALREEYAKRLDEIKAEQEYLGDDADPPRDYAAAKGR